MRVDSCFCQQNQLKQLNAHVRQGVGQVLMRAGCKEAVRLESLACKEAIYPADWPARSSDNLQMQVLPLLRISRTTVAFALAPPSPLLLTSSADIKTQSTKNTPLNLPTQTTGTQRSSRKPPKPQIKHQTHIHGGGHLHVPALADAECTVLGLRAANSRMSSTSFVLAGAHQNDRNLYSFAGTAFRYAVLCCKIM